MFADTLNLKLTITAGGKRFEIPGGDIRTLQASLHPYGFTCSVSFWVSTEQRADELFPLFVKPDLIEAQLEVVSHYNPRHLSLEALKLQGLVMHKALLKEFTVENVNLRDDPVPCRHYQVDFADPASVLWRQHFPCDLMTDRNVRELIDAHKGSRVVLNYDWDALDRQFAINTLPLGTALNTASFYDFVLWFVHTHNGILTYDCNQNTYTLSGEKKEDGQPGALDELDIENLWIEFPETLRSTVNVLNAYSEDPRRELIEQPQAIDGVFRDYLDRFPVSSGLNDQKSLETKKIIIRQHEIQLLFRNFPHVPFRPGCLIKLAQQGWSKQVLAHGTVFRVRDISLEAKAVAEEMTADHNLPHARFTVDMRSQLEQKSEKWVSLPPFQPPLFPLRVEGRIKSEAGEENEKTYQIYQDQETSLDKYRVIMPLFNDQEVIVPFEPYFQPGHFYFPAYKKARVLVALDFHAARIERFLDWGEGSRLPMDTQGNHILLGKDAQSQTSINHVYVDEKPVLNVKRASEVDTQMIKLEEGKMILEVKEES